MKRDRQDYETLDNIVAEEFTAAMIQLAAGLVMKKQPKNNVIDYKAWKPDGKPFAYIEIKCRNNDFGTYPSLILSRNKYYYYVVKATKHQVRFIVAVRHTNGIFCYRYKPGDEDSFEIKAGGRSDRGDKWDQEMVVHIPASRFKPLAGVTICPKTL